MPSNHIGNGGVEALLNAASLTSLAELDLSNGGASGRYNEDFSIDAVGLQELAAWPGLSGLRSLTLSGNDVGRTGLQALLGSPRVIGLKELVFRNNGFIGQAMLEFGFSRPELQLDVLDLGANLLQDFGAENLAGASCLRELKVLSIDRCEIHTAGALELAGAPFLGSLRLLNVNHNSFGPDGLHALLETKPPHLHTLQMVNNDLGDEGAAHLAEAPASNTLLEVDLSQNGLGNQALQALGTSKHLRKLLVLRLNEVSITRPAADALKRSPLGKRLAALEVADEEEIPF